MREMRAQWGLWWRWVGAVGIGVAVSREGVRCWTQGRREWEPPLYSLAHYSPFATSLQDLVDALVLLAALKRGSETCAAGCECVRASPVYVGKLTCTCVCV